MREKLSSAVFIVLTIAAMAGPCFSQAVQQTKTLVVSGQPGQAQILQAEGQSYVNIETLAQLANGTLSFKGNQITLTLPAANANAPTTTTQTTQSASQPANPGFSKEFMKAGIELGFAIREWRTALSSAVQNGYPVTADFVATYRNAAAMNLRLTSVAVSTDSDRSAFQLVSNLFDNMQKLSNKILAARQNMNYMSADALRDDPLNQQILGCTRSLAAMAASQQFQDDGSCH
ncbi:MAG: hypothetical protein WBW53_14960 [Terriglobales bacterium]